MITRRVLNLLTAVSVVLCAASFTLWVRSRHGGDRLKWLGETTYVAVVSRSGLVGFERWSGDVVPDSGSGYDRPANDPMLLSDRALQRIGFDAYTGEYSIPVAGTTSWTGRLTYVTVPWWVLAATLGLGPCVRVIAESRAKRVRRRAERLCATCGYDLRATPDQCPECGRTTT